MAANPTAILWEAARTSRDRARADLDLPRGEAQTTHGLVKGRLQDEPDAEGAAGDRGERTPDSSHRMP